MFTTSVFSVEILPKVRKILPIALISLLISGFTARAQYDYAQAQWTGGLMAGANVSQVDGDGYKGYNKLGPALGGVIYIPVPDVEFGQGCLAWSMEVLYSGKGASGTGSGAGSFMQSQDIRLTYAELPLQLNYWRGPRKSIYGAGFALGYLAASEEKIVTLSGQLYQFPFRKLDLSFLVTASFHIGAGFFVSPRFQYSLLSIRKKNPDLTAFGRADQFNNVFGVKLMYLFNTGDK